MGEERPDSPGEALPRRRPADLPHSRTLGPPCARGEGSRGPASPDLAVASPQASVVAVDLEAAENQAARGIGLEDGPVRWVKSDRTLQAKPSLAGDQRTFPTPAPSAHRVPAGRDHEDPRRASSPLPRIRGRCLKQARRSAAVGPLRPLPISSNRAGGAVGPREGRGLPRRRRDPSAPQARSQEKNKLVSDTTRARSRAYPVNLGRVPSFRLRGGQRQGLRPTISFTNSGSVPGERFVSTWNAWMST
jgi:hypothetical protein